VKLKIKTDFGKLARAFEKFPKETRAMVRKQLKEAAQGIKDRAASEHRYKSQSGALERDGLVSSVSGNVAVIALSPRVPYGIYVHEGTKPHIILPSRKRVLRWSDGENLIFSKRVNHPGTKPDQFLYNAANKELPLIQSRFDNALEKIVRNL
jgi:HK97 gp10 family phage protein